MEGVIQRGTGWNAQINRPAAGKTGTTNECIDAWFVGFTPELACAVYVGNDNRETLGNKMTGGVVAAPIWHDFMISALQGQPIKDFPRPKNVNEITVCAQTGLLPGKQCGKTVKVTFISGTEPQQVCQGDSSLSSQIIVEPSKPSQEELPVIEGKKKFPLLDEIETLKQDDQQKETPQVEEKKEETLQSLVEELRKRLEQRD